MKSCLGGWCHLREKCPHYSLPAHYEPVERMCVPGMDGVHRGGGIDRLNRSHASATGDSKVMRIARYFDTNPGELLGTNDIATKFALLPGSARALLSYAVRRKLVRKVITGGGEGHESLYGKADPPQASSATARTASPEPSTA